jgi:hypothetical protein
VKEMGFQLVHSIYGKTEQSAIGRAAEYGARVDTEWQCSSESTACSVHRSSIKLGMMLLAMVMGNMGH